MPGARGGGCRLDGRARPRGGPEVRTARHDRPADERPEHEPVAPAYFAADVPAIADSSWGYRIGGFGGLKRGSKLHHTPVIFVHGNQADAQNWLDVMLQFQNLAGYSMQELWALSYNGLGNYYAGAPTTVAPTAADQAYIQQNPNGLAQRRPRRRGRRRGRRPLPLHRRRAGVHGLQPGGHRRPLARRDDCPPADAALPVDREERRRLRRNRGREPRHDRLPRARHELLRLQRDRAGDALARRAERPR